jgi:hypothetical protein
MESSLHSLIPFLPFLFSHLQLSSQEASLIISQLKVKVKVTLRLTVSQPVSLGVEPHLRLMTRYLLFFDCYGLVFVGGASLTRGRVYLLYMLLVLASVVFLGSESLGTRDHISLSLT